MRTLSSFAAALHRPLHGDDDQAVFEAAEAAMTTAAAGKGGLYVSVDPGIYKLSHLTLGTNSGFFCAGPAQACVLQAVRPAADAEATCFVALKDPYAANWLFTGFTLAGGWSWGRTPYGSAPETDPWLDHQSGLCLDNAQSGPGDTAYVARSPVGSRHARGRVSELLIGGFGGDGFRISGAGANVIGPVAVFNVGGRGFVIDQYDSKFMALDAGQTGRSGVWLGPFGSSDFVQGKVWFNGGRRLAGDNNGVHIDRGSGNTLDLDIQDTTGDALVLDAATLNRVIARAGWQGELGKTDPATALVTLKGASHNTLEITAYVDRTLQAFPEVRHLVADLKSPSAGFSTYNQIVINHRGWPGDKGGWNRDWFFGPLDMTNQVIANSTVRLPQFWQGGAGGHADFTVGARGHGAGMTAFDDSSTSPGAVALYGSDGDVYLTGQDHGKFAETPGVLVDSKGRLILPGLPVYADDKAAAAGGLPKMGAYRDKRGGVHVCLGC
jgi:hypothetical protein